MALCVRYLYCYYYDFNKSAIKKKGYWELIKKNFTYIRVNNVLISKTKNTNNPTFFKPGNPWLISNADPGMPDRCFVEKYEKWKILEQYGGLII